MRGGLVDSKSPQLYVSPLVAMPKRTLTHSAAPHFSCQMGEPKRSDSLQSQDSLATSYYSSQDSLRTEAPHCERLTATSPRKQQNVESVAQMHPSLSKEINTPGHNPRPMPSVALTSPRQRRNCVPLKPISETPPAKASSSSKFLTSSPQPPSVV